MRNRISRLLAVMMVLVMSMSLFTGCFLFDDEEDETTSGTNQRAELSTLPTNIVRKSQVKLKGNGNDKVTVLVYMNGSNLESDDGSATADLKEMVAAGSSDKVNVIVQTMGTKKWQSTYGIASNRSQIYKVNGSGLTLLKDNLGQLDCTSGQTLKDFIIWGVQNYPADRYELIFWNHGGGPVYGFGYDEFQDENAMLTIDEIQSAIKGAGVYFDFIGMDCCLMSCLELCCALYDYCDYMILSEDFEPGYGWYYTDWLKALYSNTSISTVELGKKICDDMVRANEAAESNTNAMLAVIQQSMMKALFTAWKDFAYANESKLLGNNYSQKVNKTGRELPMLNKGFFSDWLNGSDEDEEEATMSSYYVTDIMAAASTIDSTESKALSAAVSQALVYVKTSAADAHLTGMSVTLPYGDSNFYKSLKSIFTNCGIEAAYITWLEKFVSAQGSSDFYDYDDFDESWNGWDDYEDDYDWSDWSWFDDDDYWSDDDNWDWDDWDYDDSFNNWFNDDYWNDEDDDWDYDGDDWFWGDDYGYDDDWFGGLFDDWDDDDWDDDGGWFW